VLKGKQILKKGKRERKDKKGKRKSKIKNKIK
jgi:hypothetical protein